VNPLPNVNGWFELPLNYSLDLPLNYSLNDGVHQLDLQSGLFPVIPFPIQLPAVDLLNGQIVDWDIRFAISHSVGYSFSFSSSGTRGDSSQTHYVDETPCFLYNPAAGGDCPVIWTDQGTAPPAGSWSIVTTAPEPSSLSLLVIGLAGLGYSLRKRMQPS
jgi:hypothetical protein